MQIARERLIEELERLLADLRADLVHPRDISQLLRPYTGGLGVHRHLAEVQQQIEGLRQEIKRLPDSRRRCAYAEDRDQYMHMLTGLSGELDRDRKYLRKKAHANDWMIITDPYFLQWDGPNKAFHTEKQYTEFIIDYIPRELKKLELFILPGPNRRIQKKFNDRIRSRGTLISYWETTEIHDRTVIRDNMTGTMLGTSFGGYGNKLAFVLDIPEKDLHLFMEQLSRIRGGA